MQAIEDVWREFRANRGASNFNERPNIAIVDWADVPTASEFELFRQYFTSKGLNVLITTPERLEFTGGRLRDGDFVIDIYYKSVLTSELLEKPDVAKATLDAYEAGAVCVINSFRAKLLHKKMSFGLLHDDANAHLFSAAERRGNPATYPVDAQGRGGEYHLQRAADRFDAVHRGQPRAAGAEAERRVRRQGRHDRLGGERGRVAEGHQGGDG